MIHLTNYEYGYFCEHFDEDLENGQCFRITFQDISEDLSLSESDNTLVWNCAILVYNKNKYEEESIEYFFEEPTTITGTSPIKNAIAGMRMFKSSVEKLRTLYPTKKNIISCGWADEHRHKAYYSFLSKLGYHHGECDGEIVLEKEYKPISPIENII